MNLLNKGQDFVEQNFDIKFEILGEPASKANQRKLVKIHNRIVPIKSKKALSYVNGFKKQCPQLDPIIECDVAIDIMIYYASRRPDLDERLILDCLQGLVYKNDRQVKKKTIYWGLDKENPRAIIRLTPFDSYGIPSGLL